MLARLLRRAPASWRSRCGARGRHPLTTVAHNGPTAQTTPARAAEATGIPTAQTTGARASEATGVSKGLADRKVEFRLGEQAANLLNLAGYWPKTTAAADGGEKSGDWEKDEVVWLTPDSVRTFRRLSMVAFMPELQPFWCRHAAMREGARRDKLWMALESAAVSDHTHEFIAKAHEIGRWERFWQRFREREPPTHKFPKQRTLSVITGGVARKWDVQELVAAGRDAEMIMRMGRDWTRARGLRLLFAMGVCAAATLLAYHFAPSAKQVCCAFTAAAVLAYHFAPFAKQVYREWTERAHTRDLERVFLAAVRSGDRDRVHSMICGIHWDPISQSTLRTALFLAVLEHNLEVATMVSAFVNEDVKSKDGWVTDRSLRDATTGDTILHAAMRSRDAALMSIVLKRWPADRYHARNGRGQTVFALYNQLQAETDPFDSQSALNLQSCAQALWDKMLQMPMPDLPSRAATDSASSVQQIMDAAHRRAERRRILALNDKALVEEEAEVTKALLASRDQWSATELRDLARIAFHAETFELLAAVVKCAPPSENLRQVIRYKLEFGAAYYVRRPVRPWDLIVSEPPSWDTLVATRSIPPALFSRTSVQRLDEHSSAWHVLAHHVYQHDNSRDGALDSGLVANLAAKVAWLNEVDPRGKSTLAISDRGSFSRSSQLIALAHVGAKLPVDLLASDSPFRPIFQTEPFRTPPASPASTSSI